MVSQSRRGRQPYLPAKLATTSSPILLAHRGADLGELR
jgi:hypothetical protein